jgi:hypothetical protein
MHRLTPEQLNEVTAQVGFTLWQTQVTENAVGAYLVFVHKVSPGKARSEVEAMFAKAEKSTLGQLLRAIQAAANPPQRLVESLDSFVEKRNWLVHHSRHESQQEMYSAVRRAALIARLDAIADEALELAKAFQAATEAHLETLGISKEQIARDAEKLLNEWKTKP